MRKKYTLSSNQCWEIIFWQDYNPVKHLSPKCNVGYLKNSIKYAFLRHSLIFFHQIFNHHTYSLEFQTHILILRHKIIYICKGAVFTPLSILIFLDRLFCCQFVSTMFFCMRGTYFVPLLPVLGIFWISKCII